MADRRVTAAGTWVAERIGAGRRAYDVYVPAGRRRVTSAPVLLLLHGCAQTAAQFAEASRFTTVADRHTIILVLPHQEIRHHLQRCWRWYEDGHQQRGTGEPAQLVEIVAAVLAERRRWRADPRRVYAAGLSAGGAMALTLAAAYPDVVAAAGVHSAPPYRSAVGAAEAVSAMAARRAVRLPPPDAPAMAPLIVVQGGADRVVSPANGDRVAAQWLDYRERACGTWASRVARHRTVDGRTADGRDYTRIRWYTRRGRRVLEQWRIPELGHAWSGGRPGGSYSDPLGPRAATVIWGFLRLHRLGRVSPTRRERRPRPVAACPPRGAG